MRTTLTARIQLVASQLQIEGTIRGLLKVYVRRGDQGEKPYCLTSECSRDVERCLTKRAPVASSILRPSRSSFSDL